MLVLLYPILLLSCIFLTIFFLLFRKYFLFGFFLLITSIINYRSESFAFNFNFEVSSDDVNSIKVLSFNVKSAQDRFVEIAPLIANYLINEDADVIFLTELYNRQSCYLLPLIKEKYPYCGYNGENNKSPSSIFFSKWPISTSKRIEVDKRIVMEEFNLDELTLSDQETKHSSIYISYIEKEGRRFYFIGAHLVGNNFYSNTDSYSIDKINSFKYLYSYLKNIQEAYKFRRLQVDAICNEIESLPKPIIVLGDMNDIGGSYVTKSIESKGLDDAWWNGGRGYGSTFEDKYLLLRLDHIFFSKEIFKLQFINIVDTGFSDHKCLVASFSY